MRVAAAQDGRARVGVIRGAVKIVGMIDARVVTDTLDNESKNFKGALVKIITYV